MNILNSSQQQYEHKSQGNTDEDNMNSPQDSIHYATNAQGKVSLACIFMTSWLFQPLTSASISFNKPWLYWSSSFWKLHSVKVHTPGACLTGYLLTLQVLFLTQDIFIQILHI